MNQNILTALAGQQTPISSIDILRSIVGQNMPQSQSVPDTEMKSEEEQTKETDFMKGLLSLIVDQL